MGRILKTLRIAEAEEKSVAPTTRMEFLGNTVDTVKMTLEVSPSRKKELVQLIHKWLNRTTYSKKQLQSLIGKLSFVTNCVRVGRLFLSRLIDQLSTCEDKQSNRITHEMRLDMEWWLNFLPGFEGSAILWLLDQYDYDQQLASDASMVGGGAVCDTEYVHFKFSDEVLAHTNNIAQRELYTILVAIRIWGSKIAGRVIRFYTDNQNSLFAINRGRTKDRFMLYCLREIATVTAKFEILLRCKYIPSRENSLPDGLSRWYINSDARRIVRRHITSGWTRRSVNEEIISISTFYSQV